MPDETYPPADPPRPDDDRRRSPFDGFSRDEFTFHNFDGEPPPDPPANEPPAYYDDEDSADPADVFMAVTVDGQTLKATPASPVSLAPRRPARDRRKAPTSARRTGLQMARTVLLSLLAAILVSTIFSLWTRPTFLPDTFRAELNQVQATQQLVNIQPTPLPTDVREIRIGIVAGHSGKPQDESFNEDPGAVCGDGLTEMSINTGVARAVAAALQRDNYEVELLEEFDPRLHNYRADALVSIHTNDCSNYGAAGTGYNAASAASRGTTRGADERLLDCLIHQYGATTGLARHYGITNDMTFYHSFAEVSDDTPTVIIEMGFMLNDRRILTEQQDLLAQGIANGVRCFLRPDVYGRPPSSMQP